MGPQAKHGCTNVLATIYQQQHTNVAAVVAAVAAVAPTAAAALTAGAATMR